MEGPAVAPDCNHVLGATAKQPPTGTTRAPARPPGVDSGRTTGERGLDAALSRRALLKTNSGFGSPAAAAG